MFSRDIESEPYDLQLEAIFFPLYNITTKSHPETEAIVANRSDRKALLGFCAFFTKTILPLSGYIRGMDDATVISLLEAFPLCGGAWMSEYVLGQSNPINIAYKRVYPRALCWLVRNQHIWSHSVNFPDDLYNDMFPNESYDIEKVCLLCVYPSMRKYKYTWDTLVPASRVPRVFYYDDSSSKRFHYLAHELLGSYAYSTHLVSFSAPERQRTWIRWSGFSLLQYAIDTVLSEVVREARDCPYNPISYLFADGLKACSGKKSGTLGDFVTLFVKWSAHLSVNDFVDVLNNAIKNGRNEVVTYLMSWCCSPETTRDRINCSYTLDSNTVCLLILDSILSDHVDMATMLKETLHPTWPSIAEASGSGKSFKIVDKLSSICSKDKFSGISLILSIPGIHPWFKSEKVESILTNACWFTNYDLVKIVLSVLHPRKEDLLASFEFSRAIKSLEKTSKLGADNGTYDLIYAYLKSGDVYSELPDPVIRKQSVSQNTDSEGLAEPEFKRSRRT